jgi:hypothetical protein
VPGSAGSPSDADTLASRHPGPDRQTSVQIEPYAYPTVSSDLANWADGRYGQSCEDELVAEQQVVGSALVTA